jgi:hypothetical protein
MKAQDNLKKIAKLRYARFGVLTAVLWQDASLLRYTFKPLIMITSGFALFDNNNWLITLSG